MEELAKKHSKEAINEIKTSEEGISYLEKLIEYVSLIIDNKIEEEQVLLESKKLRFSKYQKNGTN